MATNIKNIEVSGVVHEIEDSYSRERLKTIKSLEVSSTTPTDENTQAWINSESNESFSLPEIKDNETNEVDTWSSQKIYTDSQSLLAKITALETKTQVASDEDAATYLGGNE